MADDESTATVEDTSVAEADTSTNEEAQDLEDIEVTPEELNDETEDTEDETTDTEPSETEEESKEDEGTEEQSEEPEQSDEEKQKAFNKEMAERRIQEKLQRELSQKAEQEKYLEQAEDEKDLALRQLQVDAYNNQVERNTDKLTTQYEKAVKDFEILSSDDPVVKAEVDAAIDSFQALHVTVDSYGNPTQIRGDLYQYLQNKADSIRQLTSIGARQQVKSKEKEKSKTFTPPSRTPKEPKVDPDMAAFEEEAGKW